MIKFSCKNCGQRIKVPDEHAGKKGKCPKCKTVVVVPEIDNDIFFKSPDSQADNTQDTPKPPQLEFEKPPPAQTSSEEVSADPFSAAANEHLLKHRVEEIPPPKRRLVWFIDIWLYPLNLAGVVHLICLWLLVFLFCPLVMAILALGIEYVPIVYTLPIAYVLYYFTECIRDSATGNFRTPDFWMRPNEGKWDFISQLLIVLGCIAICFCPASVYYIVTERTDLIYWLFMACGGFFFPMVLLAVVLFDSYNALNPILIIGSIFRTFFPYCGMVLLFYSGALLLIKIDSRFYSFRLLPAVAFISRVLQLYLVFVAVGLLGRFYWKYQEKLNWEV